MYYLNKGLFDLLVSYKNNHPNDLKPRIINMSSEVAGYSPQPFMAYYSVTKKMVSSYTDVLRRECNYIGVKVVKIESGALKTNMLPSANKEYEEFVKRTKYFVSPLTKLKKMMTRELEKTNDPNKLALKFVKMLEKKNPKITYRYKRSLGLRFVNLLPEKLQDKVYKLVIR